MVKGEQVFFLFGLGKVIFSAAGDLSEEDSIGSSPHYKEKMLLVLSYKNRNANKEKKTI